MGEKFLNKAGLERLVDKLKSKFAEINSPTFTGTPKVPTPKLDTNSNSEEIINVKYATLLHSQINREIEWSKKETVLIEGEILPEEWEGDDKLYACTKYNGLLGNYGGALNSLMKVVVDYSKLELDEAIEATTECPIFYTAKDTILVPFHKPTIKIPILIEITPITREVI